MSGWTYSILELKLNGKRPSYQVQTHALRNAVCQPTVRASYFKNEAGVTRFHQVNPDGRMEAGWGSVRFRVSQEASNTSKAIPVLPVGRPFCLWNDLHPRPSNGPLRIQGCHLQRYWTTASPAEPGLDLFELDAGDGFVSPLAGRLLGSSGYRS